MQMQKLKISSNVWNKFFSAENWLKFYNSIHNNINLIKKSLH